MKNILRYAILIFALGMAVSIAIAQEQQPSQTPPASQSQPEQSTQEAKPPAVTPSPEHPTAVETGEKHESMAKAEEEEEENANLKYSPAVTALGKKIGLDAKTSYWVFTGINFGVVVIAVLWLMKSKVVVGMRNRTTQIRSAMETAKKASEDANAESPHLAGRGGEQPVAVVQVDTKHRAREHLEHRAVHLDGFFFHAFLVFLRAARSRARLAAFDLICRAALGLT